MDQGEQKVEQQIFEQFFMAIDEAETFILMDMFLFYDSIKTKSPHILIATDAHLLSRMMKFICLVIYSVF